MTQDSEHVSELLESELDTLWRFSWRLTGQKDEAADLLQRTCLRALERADHYQARGKFRSWLLCIAHRIWINEIRTRNIRDQKYFNSPTTLANSTQPKDGIAIDGDGFIHPESNMVLHEVHEAVESLPEAQRLVILLISVEGYSYKETSQILDIPIGTVMSRLARARLIIGSSLLQKQKQKKTVKLHQEHC